MKKLNLLLGILIGIITFNCSSDDDSNDSNQDELVAVWNLKSVENQGNDVPVFGCGTDQTKTFNNGNTGSEYFPEDYDGNPCDFNTLQFNWTRDGNELTITVADEGTFVNQILLLTETQLQTVVVEISGTEVPENQREIFKYEK